MNRRGSQRIKRRIPCEFDYEGHAYAGIVVDLSAEGLFLQTDTAIEPGTDLALRLRPERASELTLRGRVVRRRFTPAVLASMIRRGVGVRIMEAPSSFYELLGIDVEVDPGQVWQTVDDWGGNGSGTAPGGPITIDIQVGEALDEPAPEASGEAPAEGEGPAGSWSFAEPVAPAPEPEKPDEAFDEPWGALEATALPPPPEWVPDSLCRADALLIDQGELDDVYALLERLGADPVRHRVVDTQGFTGWERPPRVVVAGARSALRLSVGQAVESQGIVTIAVVDTHSQVLNGMLRRQGFRYVVRRPVHPEALRLLLLRALYRGRERREAPRLPFGCEITLRLRLSRRPASLLELSRTGCRLYTRDWFEPGDRLGVRIPKEVTGNRTLELAGRVVRAERRRTTELEQRVALAMRFDRLGEGTRARLEGLMAAHAAGPPPLARRERVELGAASPAGQGAAPEAGRDARAAGAGAAPTERRRAPRSDHREEVLALDPALQRVRHALFGVDLSDAGLRVEPHPELVLGERMKLALYDAACATALTVGAVVARDDGPRGLWLRFDPLDAEKAAELARILARPPQLEAAVAGRGRAVVLAELVPSSDA